MKTMKKSTAFALAGILGLSSLAGASAFAAEGDAAAPTNAQGSVYVSIEKSAAYKKDAKTLDYILAPTKVNLADVAEKMGTTDALTPDDGITDITILDVLMTAYGEENFTVQYNASYHCYYVKAIKDSGAVDYVATEDDYEYGSQVASLSQKYSLNASFNGTIKTANYLSENDLIANGGSGWMIAQNNAGPYYGVSTTVATDDVLRMEWSTFNGMDVGYTGYFYNPEDTANWGWTPGNPFAARVDKDALVKKLAEINHEYELSNLVDDQKTAYDNANAALKSITKTSVESELAALNSEF